MKEVFVLVLSLLYNGDLKYHHPQYSVTIDHKKVIIPLVPGEKDSVHTLRPGGIATFAKLSDCRTFGRRVKLAVQGDEASTRLRGESFLGYALIPPEFPVFTVTPICKKLE